MEIIRKVKKNSSKILFVIGVLAICMITLIAYANNSNSYGVQVRNDGSSYVLQNSEVSLKKVIVQNDGESLTYNVELNSLKQSNTNKEIAVLIDTSSSMTTNDKKESIKPKSIEFITNLLNEVENAQVSLSDNTQTIIGLTTLNEGNLATYTNAIQNLTNGEVNDLNVGLDNAINSFSTSTESEKYLIIFTDATDKIRTKLEEAINNGINVYSILLKLTNSEYLAEDANMGKTQKIDATDYQSIYNDINKSITNIKITDNFTQEVQKYFNFEVISENADEVTINSTGYEWNIERLKSGENKNLQFKLTLRDDVIVDASKINKEIYTSTTMTVNYTNTELQVIEEQTQNSPTFIICQYYSLTIKAVSEKSNDLPVEGIQIQLVGYIVTGQDEQGNDIKTVVYNDILTTNSKGEVKVEQLTQIGEITFEIKPIVNKVGYDETEATSIIITNKPEESPLSVNSDKLITQIINRDISVILPIKIQAFNLKVEATDLNNSNIKLGNIDYKLIQPKLNSKYEMEALYGATDENGILIFNPAVMTKAGTYDYVLTQEGELQDYETMGVVIIRITFDENGQVVEAIQKYNEKVEAKRISSSEVLVKVGNACEQDEVFGIEINVVDSKDEQIKIEGATYTVKVTKANGNVIVLNGNKTNSEGKIELEATGNGNILVEIFEESPKPGYVEDKVVKQIYISRKDGTLNKYIHTTPEDVNAIPDSENNKVIVNLKSQIKTEQNKIRIQVVDLEEQDVVVPDVAIGLTKVGTTEKYLATTDENGIVEYTIPDETAGVYLYKLTLESEVPEGYTISDNELGVVSIAYNDNKQIYDVSEAGEGQTAIIQTETLIENKDEFTYNMAFVKVVLTPDGANTYKLKINLVDEENLSTPICGAKYDISIISGNVMRKIIQRATDESGNITTRLIGNENITITITQTESISGYAINTQTQVIQLVKTDAGYSIIAQTPYTYEPDNGQNIGAEIVDTDVIYHDTNAKKIGNNAILNLYINKYDINDNLVGNVKTIITSTTIMDPEFNELDYNYTLSDENGYVLYNGNEMEGLKIQKLNIPNETEREDIIYMYELDENDNIKENTKIELKLTFRYNELKRIIEVTNVEATWGNRLIKSKTFNGYETAKAYESNVYLDIYTNYDEVGNFALDLSKIDKEGQSLTGAKYDVTIIRPDGSKLIRKDLEITDKVEFAGFAVTAGTRIEITEKVAPIGYELNQYTEIINITELDEKTGAVTVELEDGNYANSRIVIKDSQQIILEDGSIKTNLLVDLIDYELATFKFGIQTLDKVTNNAVEGYSFKISSSQGSQANTGETDSLGKTMQLVGSNYQTEGFEVTYRIDTFKQATYYKKLTTPIEVRVIFNEFGQVDINKTLEAQTDLGYRTVWDILQANTEDGNDIDIKILVETEEALTVNIESVNIITNESIQDIEYEITPSLNIEAKGSTSIEVGYVAPNSIQTYNIKQINGEEIQEFATLDNQQFKVVYDESGNLLVEGTEAITPYIEVVSVNEKTINLKLKLLPKLIVNIESVDINTNDIINNIEYKIEPTDKISSTGNTKVEIEYVEPKAKDKGYTIEQINGQEIAGYKTLQNMEFTLSYDEVGNITSANSRNFCLEIVSTSNNEISIRIKLLPTLVVNVETIDNITRNTISNAQYKITPSEKIEAIGSNKIEVGYVIPNSSEVQYTIEQTEFESEYTNNYVKIDNQTFKVDYDELGNVISATNITDGLEVVSTNKNSINIKIKMEPALPIVITNVSYFDEKPLLNSNFEITLDEQTKNIVTNSNGVGVNYLGKLGNNNEVIYNIKQTSTPIGYAKVEEFQVKVIYDENRNIKNTQLLGEVNKYVEFVKTSYTVSSSESDIGYNGNDKGILNIKIKNYPDIQFEIENVDRQNNEVKLLGASYSVESTINTSASPVIVSENSIGIAHLDKAAYSQTVTYTIKELNAAVGYQSLAIPAKVEVDFNELGTIQAVRVVKRDDVVTATRIENIVNYRDIFTVKVQIKSNPELKIKISKLNEETREPISNVDFEITARLNKDNLAEYSEEEISALSINTQEVTEEQYKAQVLDRLKITEEQIEEMKRAIAYENIIVYLRENNKLTEDEYTQIEAMGTDSQKLNKIVEMKKMTTYKVNDYLRNITNQNIIDRLISKGTTTSDRVNKLLDLVKKLIRLDVDNVTTDENGNIFANIDKTLANKTIEYTIKETRKKEGYDWPDELLIFEVSFDSTGKMVPSSIRKVSGNMNITSSSADEFKIGLEILNTESKEIKIHLSVEDAYDSNKKLESAKFSAFLVDTKSGNSYSPDGKYETTLTSGTPMIVNGEYTHIYGEDLQTLGKYEENAGTRILRLVETNVPDTYYINGEKHSNIYQSISYAMLINVSLDDEGRIKNVSLYNPGNDSYSIGYIADSRYLQVSNSGNTINIAVRYYPMLQVQMQAVDMYTGESLNAEYSISTYLWGSAATEYYVKTGSIPKGGRLYNSSYKTSVEIDDINSTNKVALAPTEADNNSSINIDTRERLLYIYERQEPTSPIQYQKYRSRYITHSSQYLVAVIKVKYDELGTIKETELVQNSLNNNIKNDFVIAIASNQEEYTMQIKIKYAPITTITATTVDKITQNVLGGVRILPYINNTEVTNQSYEYRTQYYYTTGNDGAAKWTYWGASEAETQKTYKMKTEFASGEYNGYFLPGEISLDVSYGEDGRINGINVTSVDEFGEPNAEVISWENNDIKIKILYNRKFNMKINKVDYYNSTEKLTATFNVASNKGLLTQAISGNVTTLGRVYAGETIRYTLSESVVPTGYIKAENIELNVKFAENGTVESVNSNSEYYEFVTKDTSVTNINSANKKDLEINVKNKPRFDVNLVLSDKFYPSLKLEGGIFEIQNDKGEVATGSVTTDRNGTVNTYVGTIYPSETVTYTIIQKNVVNGYYANNEIIKLQVVFDENGYIKSYSVLSGEKVINLNPQQYLNKREIGVEIFNMPKDVKIGIYKYDSTTNEAIANVKFNLTTSVDSEVKTITTNEDGIATALLDTFVINNDYRKVTYTISEIEVPNSYRKIQPLIIEVTYNPDGSIYFYDVLSNESKISVEVGINRQTKEIGKIPIHLKLTIPNDNAYDLIIKNEDINYPELGIEGTKYDVSINGIGEEVVTNEEGIAKILNQTQNGNITIRVAERTPGEGYRVNNNNDTTIEVYKGENIYSLALNSNSNPTYADVEVDEEHGTITVTFKNETKLELNVLKEDAKTGAVMKDIEFEIIEEEIDNYGNTVAGTQNIITTDVNNTTDEQGLLYFELGLSKQNKIMQYTITEKETPDGYFELDPIKVKVTFDMYGRISNIEDDSYYANCYLATSTGKSHNMIFNILNEPIPGDSGDSGDTGDGSGKPVQPITPEYTVKIVSTDSQSGNRINGSIFQVEVFDETEATFKSVTGTTSNETKQIARTSYILEKGVMKVSGLTVENNAKIAINQIETAIGYIYGSNQVSGNVIVNANYTTITGNPVRTLELTLVDNGGFDVSIDNVNREIVIKVKNNPQIIFDITKIDANTDEKVKDAKFTVTSVIEKLSGAEDTGLNNTAKQTDDKGHTTLEAGIPYPGKTVIYAISEEKLDGYNKLEDIILLVKYDTKGNILYYEILSNTDDVEILEETISIDKKILSEGDIPGIQEVEYTSVEVPTGIGTKTIKLEVKNTQEAASQDYQVIIEKHHELDPDYPYFIQNVTFEIKVTQEFGEETIQWTDITNENGIITSKTLNGYGYITIEIKEISGPDGYKLDLETKTIKLYRDRDSKKLKIISSDIGYDFSQDNTKIYLKPVNEVATGVYDIVINKVDKANSTLISNNPAQFELSRMEKYETVTTVEDEETGEMIDKTQTNWIKEVLLKAQTDEAGRLVADKFNMPDVEGTYRYVLKETKAPTGYKLLKEQAELDVTFAKNVSDEMVITNVVLVSGENVKVLKTTEQFISLVVENESETANTEITLDITKVDENNNAITNDTAIFKVANKQTNEIAYFETDENSKLNIAKLDTITSEGTYTYVINEIKAPEGYSLNRNDITVNVCAKQDEEGNLYIETIEVDGENIVYKNPAQEGELPDTIISIDVVNKEGQSGNVNTKPYTVILNKVDSKTKEHITEYVEFTLSLVNGEIVHAATNEQGQIIIENVYMPAKPEEYEIVVKELTTPEGYLEDTEMKIVKATFEGNGDNMVISNIQLDDTYNKNIEIVTEECTEDKIVLNVLNEKANPELYVISKEDGNGKDIYEVQRQIYEGRHYTIDRPFIDTKVAKYGSNMTVQEFIDNLESNGIMTILDKDGNELAPTDRVKTGMTLRATLGTQELTFTIIVKGDVDGDGRVRTKDLDKLIKHLAVEQTIADPIMLRALDMESDGKIRTTDLNSFYYVMEGN